MGSKSKKECEEDRSHTNTSTEFDLGNTADDTQRASEEREQRVGGSRKTAERGEGESQSQNGQAPKQMTELDSGQISHLEDLHQKASANLWPSSPHREEPVLVQPQPTTFL